VLCDCCSDPIDRGDRAAVLSNGEHIHDGCYQIVQAAAEEVVTTPAIPRLSGQSASVWPRQQSFVVVALLEILCSSLPWYAQSSSSE
jgi:hypothetical protein